MILTAPIPVFGRFPLVRLTISRLLKQGVTPIILGHENEAKEIAKEFNVEFILIDNDPLGDKWNAGFAASRYYKADAVMFMGSSDWCSDDYVESIKLHINDFGMLGMLACHFADVADQIRLVHWKGYSQGKRYQEPIGIGRVLRADFLDKINWMPFDPQLNSGLDWSMWLNALKTSQEIGILPDNGQINLLSISTNKWNNKHKFSDHWNGALNSDKCDISMIENGFNKLKELL
jgi:hypothetical protein